MRIIMTIDYSPWSRYTGGAQREVHEIANALANRGHDVAVVYTKPAWEKINPSDGVKYRIRWARYFGVRTTTARPWRTLMRYLSGAPSQHY